MKTSTANAILGTILVPLGAVALVLSVGTSPERTLSEPVATPQVTCPASDDGAYMSQYMTDWFNQTYPGMTRMSYDGWVTMTDAAYDTGDAEDRRLWDTYGDACNGLHSSRDVVESFVFAVPHDEAPPADHEGGSSGGIDVDVDVPSVRSPVYCSWSFRGGFNCGIRG